MALGIIFAALLLSTLAVSLQEDSKQTTQNIDYSDDDDYYDEPESINGSHETQETEDTTVTPEKSTNKEHTKLPKILEVDRDREELTTEKQVAKYEVTELVIDVPDVSTKRVPIVANFTITRPLNLAEVSSKKINNVETSVKDEGDEKLNSIFISHNSKTSKTNLDANVKGKNNKFNIDDKDEHDYFSKYIPKDSFEEEFGKEFGSDEDDFDELEVKEQSEPSKSFKDHFHSFRKSIANGFDDVVNKHKDGIHNSLRKIVNGPISFFNKLHRKTSDLAKKLHRAVSRHDKDDETGYYGVDHDYGEDK